MEKTPIQFLSVFISLVILSSCGGGGGENSPSVTNVSSTPAPVITTPTPSPSPSPSPSPTTAPILPKFGELETIRLNTEEQLNYLLSPTNTEAGPFMYKLAYGPKGVEISDSGLVTGTPIAFTKEERQEFNLSVDVLHDGIAIDNVQLDIVVEGNVSNRNIVPYANSCTRDTLRWADINGNGLLNLVCPLYETYMVLEMDGNRIYKTYVEFDQPEYSELKLVTQQDVNGDDVEEIILGYEHAVYIIDGENKEVIRVFEIGSDDGAAAVDYNVIPIEYGYPGILILSEATADLRRMDGTIETQPVLTNNTDSLIANIDGDPEPEILSAGTLYDFNGPAIAIDETYTDFVDMDGDGIAELVKLGSDSKFDDFLLKQYPVKAVNASNADDVVNFTIDIPEPWSDGDEDGLVYRPEVQIINLDDDDEMEILLRYDLMEDMFVFDRVDDVYVYIHSLKVETDTLQVESFVVPTTTQELIIPMFGTGEYKKYSSETGQFENMDYSHPDCSQHLYDPYGISRSFIQSDGSISFYCDEITIDGRVIAKTNSNDQGEVLFTNYLPSIPNPTNRMFSLHEIPFDEVEDPTLIVSQSSFSGPQLYDVATQELLNQYSRIEHVGWPSTIGSGDFDNDGFEDLFFLNSIGTPVTWFDIERDIEIWNAYDAKYTFGFSDFKISDIDYDGVSEMMMIRRFEERSEEFPTELIVNKYINDVIVNTLNYPIESLSYSRSPRSIGLQDIDDDGMQEVIILISEGTCRHHSSRLLILDHDFSFLSDLEIPGCINLVPTIASTSNKRNLIVSSVLNDVNFRTGLFRRSYSQFVELDWMTGDQIWESKPFHGQMKKGTLKLFGDDPYISRKTALFYAGYTFF